MYAVVQQLEDDEIPVAAICQALKVSRSGYYEFKEGRRSAKAERDQRLSQLIHEVFIRHKQRYGARRIAIELQEMGEVCSVPRVSRLMKKQGLKAIQPKRFRPKTTDSEHGLGYSPNLLLDAPSPTSCDQVWVGDITYIPLIGGIFDYFAMVMDLFSRKIVGWAMQDNMEESLVIGALRQAIATRQPARGLIHHSDRGGQYASHEYRRLQKRAGAKSSMSRANNCYDNAFMESYIGTVKRELEMTEYESRSRARKEIREYVTYYNTERRHSSIGYITPVEFETKHRGERGIRRRPK